MSRILHLISTLLLVVMLMVQGVGATYAQTSEPTPSATEPGIEVTPPPNSSENPETPLPQPVTPSPTPTAVPEETVAPPTSEVVPPDLTPEPTVGESPSVTEPVVPTETPVVTQPAQDDEETPSPPSEPGIPSAAPTAAPSNATPTTVPAPATPSTTTPRGEQVPLVEPSVSVSPQTTLPGKVVTVSGSNFIPGETAQIFWGSSMTLLGYKTVSQSGSFTGYVTIPSNASAGYGEILVISSSITIELGITIELPAVATVSVSPSSGAPGTLVTAYGTNFPAGALVNIRWGSATGSVLGYRNATSTGSFSGVFRIPSGIAGGSYKVFLQSGSVVASTTITVLGPPAASITLSPTSGLPGARVTVTGTNFVPGQRVNIRWDTASGPILGYKLAASNGTISGVVLVPYAATAGIHKIVLQSSTTSASANFTVLARPAATVVVSPTTAMPGERVSVSGKNFAPGERVNIRWGSATGPILGYRNAGTTGTMSGSILVPYAAPAGVTRIYLQAPSATASAPFTVKARPKANVSLSENSGTYGDVVVLSGWNFLPNEQITVTWPGGLILARVYADSNGTFSANIKIPPTAQIGDNTITARGGTSGYSAGIRFHVYKIVSLVVSPRAVPGADIYIRGEGFAPGEEVIILFEYTEIGRDTASSTGIVEGTITLSPDIAYGTYSVAVTNVNATRIAVSSVEVIPQTEPKITAPSSAVRGARVTISGSGFGPNEVVRVGELKSNILLGEVVAWPDGTFSGYTDLPLEIVGASTLAVQGTSSGRYAETAIYVSYGPASADIPRLRYSLLVPLFDRTIS